MTKALNKISSLMRWAFNRMHPARVQPGLDRGVQYQRWKIATLALIIGIGAATIELPMPLEDGLRTARAQLRTKAVSGEILIIAVDDASLNALQASQPSRRQDSELVRRLFAAGASRVVFDKAYADTSTTQDDLEFAQELSLHKGKIWLGASPVVKSGLHQHAGLLPIEPLRRNVQLASMMGQTGPFGLSVRLPTSTIIAGDQVASISSVLAASNEIDPDENWYRPDWAFDVQTIPTYSYIDVLHGNVDEQNFAGKNVVVAPTHLDSRDFHNLPLGGKIAGVYFHVLAAETLRQGLPIDLGWYPAIALAALLIAVQCKQTRASGSITAGVMVVLAGFPAILDSYAIEVDVLPAALSLAFAYFKLRRLEDRIYTRSTTLVIPNAVMQEMWNHEVDLYALRIDNLADVPEANDPTTLSNVLEKMAGIIRAISGPKAINGRIAFEKDTILWAAPKADMWEIEEHGLGLIALLTSSFAVAFPTTRMELAIGVDVNHKLEAADRMNNALQAAHLAARAGQKTRLANEEFVKEKARRLKLLSAIDRAMLTGTLEVWFQPKLTLSNHEVIGAEALLRWGNEEAIDATTSEIITLAEEHGRIDELTIYVLNLAMEQIMRALAQSQKFKLAVNISAHTLQSSTIVHHVDRLSARHGFPLERLILEVTETTPLADKLTLETIKELQRRGVSFSIDDFGTGRSSLDYLLRVPSEELKIDQTFIKAMMHADNMEAVVKATIEMSHAFGKAVVAEGVEDEVTAKRLTKMGCDLGQGFFFSPALPIEQLLRFMNVGRAAA